MTQDATEMDWTTWYDRWERQQEAYVAYREDRFNAMLAMLGSLPPEFVAVDLACGPGSLARRILGQFPRARVIAIDFDPVMLAMARPAIPASGGRLTVIDGDLADPEWPARLGLEQVDAAVSTTAIHWLHAGDILKLYRTVAGLLRPGGIFMNGDHMEFGAAQPLLHAAAKRVRNSHSKRAFESGAEEAEQWWAALAEQPAAADLLAAHNQAFAAKERPSYDPGFVLHEAALRDAGFREVATTWQFFENRVLTAIR